jgi:hypothetical protein
LYATNAAHDLLERLHRQEAEGRGWRRFAAKRLGQATGETVVVQAFGGPCEPDRQRTLIVLTMHHAERER